MIRETPLTHKIYLQVVDPILVQAVRVSAEEEEWSASLPNPNRVHHGATHSA